jgi:hypothetical protein
MSKLSYETKQVPLNLQPYLKPTASPTALQVVSTSFYKCWYEYRIVIGYGELSL